MTEPAAPAAPAAPTPPAAPAAPAGPWYGDKIDAATVGFWQNKGIDPADPVAVASKLTEFYRKSESFIGAPPEEMIRIPKANAAEADIKAYWGRIGVPAEGKDYDLSTVKRADGKELSAGFMDVLRDALLNGRVPKDRAAEVGQRLVKRMESDDAAALAETTRIINEQKQTLKTNWGPNEQANLVVAKSALDTLGKAAGLTPEQITAGWDALSKVGGIGASYAMEMLRVAGAKMGEAPYIGAQPGGGTGVLSRDQAKAEIETLKRDKDFGARLLKGDTESRRKWDNLHKVAFGQAA